MHACVEQSPTMLSVSETNTDSGDERGRLRDSAVSGCWGLIRTAVSVSSRQKFSPFNFMI